MSESEPYSTNDEAYEQLVAYLDGELDAETSKQVERRLAENVEYRRELQQLQRAWDMLDELPRAEVSESFTQTTVEMVALSAVQELTEVKGRHGRRTRVLWGAGGAGVVLAALTSYLAVSAYFARPNRQLVRDLPVIQNMDLYEVVDSVEFLRQLEETGLFAEESDDAARAQEPRPRSTTPLAQMSDAEKAAVLQKKRRFDELSPEEQARLRQIHDPLSRDPQQTKLQRVLERYHDWLQGTFTVAERAEVLSLPADQRIEKIEELLRAQRAKRLRMMAGGLMMSSADLTIIHDWFDKFLDDHDAEIRAALPDEPPFEDLKRNYDRDRDRYRLRFDYTFRRDPDRPRPSKDEIARLQALVSKEAQQVLADAEEDERARIVLFWIYAAVLSRLQTNPSLEELDAFAHDKEFVNDAERRWLESLPRDRMLRELRVLYKQRRFAGDPSKKSPWDRSPGGDRKPGPPPPGPGFEGPPPPMPGAPWGKPDDSLGPPPSDDSPSSAPTDPARDSGK